MKIFALGHLVWLILVCVLGGWWAHVLMKQAKRIAELETALGVAESTARAHWARTEFMLIGEAAAFVSLLILAATVLFVLYWREARRARGLQAFFASVTHELRTPLTSIRLQAESIADSAPEKSADRPLLDRLLEDTTRLESQVERTLELARVEGGGAVLNHPFRLKQWLDYFLETWAQGYGSRLEASANIGDILVQADASAVQVIFKNLIDNSLKHSGHRGKVKVLVTAEQVGDWVVIRYTDDGEGVKGDVRELGRLFYKGETSQGAGVGLYLVDMLMQRMGGKVEFWARPQLEAALWFRRGS